MSISSASTIGETFPGEPVLRVDQLTKVFPRVVANDRVSFDVCRGEIHCLLGENGAGKTTLTECIYGFYKPDGGIIYIEEKPVHLSSPSDAIHLGIGMVHQHFVLAGPLTVVENIMVGTNRKKLLLDTRSAEERIQKLCDQYGIELDLHAKVEQLSVGEQQWVEILKALYVGVKLLILDEPTAVLTPQESDRLFDVLEKMKQDGLSIIFITHKLREVLANSDRVTVLRKGKVVATVNTPEVSKEQLAEMMVGRSVDFCVAKEDRTAGQTVLDVQDLRAESDRNQEALCGVTFSLREGEVLGVAGVAGNGQRELAEALIGVRPSTAGRIWFKGVETTQFTPGQIMKMGMGYIPQDRINEGLVPDFTIEENLVLGVEEDPRFSKGAFMDTQAVRAFAEECIRSYEIATPGPDQITRLLSGGNLQKVIIARELSMQPRCLIANQPTRGLDVGAIEYIHCQIVAQRDRGAGVLLISEDLEEIFNLSDRIAVMFKGQIMGIFDAKQISLEEVGLLMAGVQREGA